MALWAPSEADDLEDLDDPEEVAPYDEIVLVQAPEPEPEEEIEVFEVVSPTRRRLTPTGTR